MSKKSVIDEININQLIEICRIKGFSDEQINILKKSIDFRVKFVTEKHIFLAIKTAIKLISVGLEYETIISSILYEQGIDYSNLSDDIINEFGESVKNLILYLSRFVIIKPEYIKESEYEKYRKMVLGLAGDLRVVMILLAYYSELMKYIFETSQKNCDSTVRLIQNVYASIANRMGLQMLKSEMENLSFAYFEPEQFKYIKEELAKIEESRKEYVNEVVEELKLKLSESGIKAHIYGRTKHLYSIWQKMKNKGKSLEEIHDIMGFRIIIESKMECYSCLGIIHDAYKPIVGRFKDYIAVPKSNGYQSLHTTVKGPKDKKIEIQIRTAKMHEIAEKGIAAHWLYKEKKSASDKKIIQFGILRNKRDKFNTDDGDFLSLKLFQNEIFVFTPAHNLVVLPKGATALDFAFAVHSQVGMHCVGAKVDGNIVPLKYTLQTGNTIEISTSSKRTPNADWLNFVITSKAKSKIKNFVRQTERQEKRQIGREIVEKLLKKYKYSFSKLLKDGTLDDVVGEYKFQSVNSLFLSVGEEKFDPDKIIKYLKPEIIEEDIETSKPSKRKKKTKISGPPVEVDGLRNVVIRFAKCCMPIPGDHIEGYVTRGRGVTIHRKNCPKLRALEKERLIEVNWITDFSKGEPYMLKVISENKPGLLAAMSDIMANNAINIQKLYTENLRKNRIATFFHFFATSELVDKVARSLRKLRFVNNVIKIKTNK